MLLNLISWTKLLCAVKISNYFSPAYDTSLCSSGREEGAGAFKNFHLQGGFKESHTNISWQSKQLHEQNSLVKGGEEQGQGRAGGMLQDQRAKIRISTAKGISEIINHFRSLSKSWVECIPGIS